MKKPDNPESVVFISNKGDQFTYFDEQLDHPDWVGKIVLDFGGNIGNFLLDPNCTVPPENYYCLDVIRKAAQTGQERHPKAHFFHFDRYNWPLNLEGTRDLPVPDLGIEFDFIVAYSVFTHLPRAEMHETVGQLIDLLAPGGVLAFTFIDPHFKAWPGVQSNLSWQCDQILEDHPEFDPAAMLEKSRGADWCALIDWSELYVNQDGELHDIAKPGRRYDVYHSAGFMQREFPDSEIRAPANREQHHCCLIRK